MCPIYEFVCLKCQRVQEKRLPMKHGAIFCPDCDWIMEKQIGTPSKPRIRGKGCYLETRTDWD